MNTEFLVLSASPKAFIPIDWPPLLNYCAEKSLLSFLFSFFLFGSWEGTEHTQVCSGHIILALRSGITPGRLEGMTRGTRDWTFCKASALLTVSLFLSLSATALICSSLACPVPHASPTASCSHPPAL